MKKNPASNYVGPAGHGRQQDDMDKRGLIKGPRPDTAVRVVPQEFTTEQKNQAKANIGVTE